MNKELVLILYALRCKALQTSLCKQIGFKYIYPAGIQCVFMYKCAYCPLHTNQSTRQYPDQIAITSLNLYME